MSNLEFDLDALSNDAPEDTEGIKSLRAALKSANAQIKQANKELGEFRATARTATVTDLLRSKGVPEAAFGLYPKDAEATEEAVVAWVGQYGAAFGVTPTPTNLPQSQVQAMQQVQSASAAAPAPGALDTASLMARIQAATSKQELDAIYAEVGLRPAQ